jgi:HTH-type transcriptional regulator / antitoxin HigA
MKKTTIGVLDRYVWKMPIPREVKSDAQNRSYLAALADIESKEHKTDEEREYANLLAARIAEYEKERFPIPALPPRQILLHLMEANGLTQSDLLSIFKHKSVISDVLNGKREMSKDHIRALSQRFGLSTDVFMVGNETRALEREARAFCSHPANIKAERAEAHAFRRAAKRVHV